MAGKLNRNLPSPVDRNGTNESRVCEPTSRRSCKGGDESGCADDYAVGVGNCCRKTLRAQPWGFPFVFMAELNARFSQAETLRIELQSCNHFGNDSVERHTTLSIFLRRPISSSQPWSEANRPRGGRAPRAV